MYFHICLSRSDIPDGVVYIHDLQPNSSTQKNTELQGQTRYVNRLKNDAVAYSTAGRTLADYNGLQAYLADRVEPTASSWTKARLTTVANAIIARLDAGLSMLLTDVNAVIQATFAASDLTGAGSNSTGTLEELLFILSGKHYVLPEASLKCSGGVWSAAQAGSFTYDVMVGGDVMVNGEWVSSGVAHAYDYKGIRPTYNLDSYMRSVGTDNLNGFTGGTPDISAPTLWASTNTLGYNPWAYRGGLTGAYTTVPNARVVVVYDYTGAIAV